jgi:hypothetical protein
MNLATGGNFNMAIGVGALGSGVLITGGNSNVAIGNSAGQNLAGGSASNIFIGANAGQAATATGNQTIIGNGAAVNLTTAPGANEIIGDSCAPNFTAGYFNVIIGSSGGGGATTCSYSTIIGRLAGPTYSTGSNSIIIGYACDVPSSSASGQISIGNMIYGTGCTGTGATPSSGQIGIGVPSPTAILHVAPGTTSNAQIRLPSGSTPSSPNDGDLWYDGTHLDFRHAGVTTDLLAGGGGSPGAPLNSVQYDNGGVFGGAAHFNIDASGRPNVDTGYAYMYAGTKEALYGVPNVAGDNFFEGEAGNHTVTGEANFGTGTNALSSLTTGQRNVAVGVAACQFLTTGSQNVAFGFGAMANCISESGSVAIGGAALSGGSSGGTNVAIGASALLGNTTGSGNFAMGFHALLSNTTGSGSIGIGTGVLVSNTTGRNLAIGALAIQVCTGSGNCSIGFQSGQSVTTANNNVAVGDNALFGPGCGDLNTAIGTACLGGNAGIFTGDHCTVVGSQAGGNMSSGVANGLFGWLSGFNISSGSNNILLGYSTGNSITTGSHNLVLGDSVDTGSNVSGCIVIGQNATNRLDYNLTNSGKWTAKAAMVLPVSAVASLPAGVAGAMAFVNDATQTMTAGVGAVVAGGGANTVPVYHDGTNWRIG